MQPELIKRVKTIINECWKVGGSKEQGKTKLSARTVYQTIGQMTEVSTSTSGCKRGRQPQTGGSIGTKQKKARVSFEGLDLAKDLSLCKKPEKQAYLNHYGMKKSGNKPELIKRIEEYMFTQ